MEFCAFLRNLIIGDECENSNYNDAFGYLFETDGAPGSAVSTFNICRLNKKHITATTNEDLLGVFAAIQSMEIHTKIRADLATNLWTTRGPNGMNNDAIMDG